LPAAATATSATASAATFCTAYPIPIYPHRQCPDGLLAMLPNSNSLIVLR
jgi:hypothetical protein